MTNIIVASSEEIFEKIAREENVFKKAKLIDELVKIHSLRVVDIAIKLNTSSTQICHWRRLLRLPELVVDGFLSETLSLTHLLILSRLKNDQEMIAAFEQVLEKDLTTLQTEELVREKLFSIKSEGEYISTTIKDDIVKKFKDVDQEIMVNILQTRVKAKITISIKGSAKKTSTVLQKLATKI